MSGSISTPGRPNVNPLYITSNNASYGTLVVRNSGANGLGLYDDTSGRHYFRGKLGINNLEPTFGLDVGGVGRFSHIGNAFDGAGSYSSALWVHGYTGTGITGGRVSNGVTAGSTDGRGVYGISQTSWGVAGECLDGNTYGVLGSPGTAVYGHANAVGKYAGHFVNEAAGSVALRADGIAEVKTLRILGGADLAEPFDVGPSRGIGATPGAVVVIDPARPGELRLGDTAYDSRVAGVISGANDLAPGMVMSAEDSPLADGAHPVALSGRVWCQVDASFGAIEPGDLLTTAPTPGHAMKASDANRRGGAVLGKAMTGLATGQGLVLVLVSLQ